MSARLEIDGKSLERAKELLDGVPGGIQKAMTRALNRALQEGRTEGVRSVTREYTVKAKTVRPTFKMKKASATRLEASLDSSGSNIPLEEYAHRPNSDTTGKKRKPVKVGVKKGGLKPLGQGFIWNGKVMRRREKARLPIDRTYGPAVPVVLNNDKVVDNIVDKMSDSVDKRLAHETERILSNKG
jgi:hypothetical protein